MQYIQNALPFYFSSLTSDNFIDIQINHFKIELILNKEIYQIDKSDFSQNINSYSNIVLSTGADNRSVF